MSMCRLHTIPKYLRPALSRVPSTDGTTPEDMLRAVACGELAAWSPDAAPGALVLTQIVPYPAGRELYLYVIAGYGILPVADEVAEDLKCLAKANDCKWISASAFTRRELGWKRVARSLSSLEFKPEYTHYRAEIN